MAGKGKRSGKGKGKQTHQRKTQPQNPISLRIFPKEVIANILLRLPVKCLLQFRCVCKPWRSLISNPQFFLSHLRRFPNTLIIQTAQSDAPGQLVSFPNHPGESILPPLEGPIDIVGRDCFSIAGMVVVGSSCGVVCLSNVPPKLDDSVVLWNPATRRAKAISLSGSSILDKHFDTHFSIGFGYDLVGNDYKIVILGHRQDRKGVDVDVYSLNFGSWRRSIFTQKLLDCPVKCDAVIGEVPCWMGTVQHGDIVSEALLHFNIVTSLFMEYRLPETEEGTCKRIVNLQGSRSGIAMLVWDEPLKFYFDIWVMDDNAWTKRFFGGPILGVERVIGCSRTGEVVVQNAQGCLSLYDMESKETTDIDLDGAKGGIVEVFDYVESLVSFTGEKKTLTLEPTNERTVTEVGSSVLNSIWFPHWYYYKPDFRAQWGPEWRKARAGERNQDPDTTSPP